MTVEQLRTTVMTVNPKGIRQETQRRDRPTTVDLNTIHFTSLQFYSDCRRGGGQKLICQKFWPRSEF